MGDDGNTSDQPKTSVKFRLMLTPAAHADDRVTGLLSNLAFDIATMVGCSGKTAARANALSIEESSATIRDNLFSSGEFQFDLALMGEKVLVHSAVRPTEVEIPGTESWFQPDEPQRDMGKDPSKTIRRKRTDIVAQPVEDRRVDRGSGGAGLARLTTESKKRPGTDKDGDRTDGDDGSSAPTATVVHLRKEPS